MNRRGRLILVMAIVCGCAGAAFGAAAEDWPKYLGPRGDGISREKLSADHWPRSPKPLWSKQVGVGHASPVAVDGRVYLFHMVGSQDHLTCFDADSGKDLAAEVREYYIPDFSNWKDHDSFESEFDKLLRDLRATEK